MYKEYKMKYITNIKMFYVLHFITFIHFIVIFNLCVKIVVFISTITFTLKLTRIG